MASPSEKIWIALIDKVTYGPLTIEEVQLLLSQKILKHNDFLLNSQEEKPSWKFVWQYSNFDRRAEQKEIAEEKREKRPVEAAQSVLLPEEITKISIEDLSLNAQPIQIIPKTSVNEPSEEVSIELSSESFKKVFFLVPIVGFTLLALVFSNFFSGKSITSVVREVSKEAETTENNPNDKLKETSPLSEVTPLIAAKKGRINAPQPNNRGENVPPPEDLLAEEANLAEHDPIADEFEGGRRAKKSKRQTKAAKADPEEEIDNSSNREPAEEDIPIEEEPIDDFGETDGHI